MWARPDSIRKVRVRILVCINLYPPNHLGGCEILCQQVVERLRARGHVMSVLTSSFGVKQERDEVNGVAVRRVLALDVPYDSPPSMSRVLRMRVGLRNGHVMKQVLQEDTPDLVFFWSQRRLTVGCVRAAQRLGVPQAFIFNDDSPVSFVPSAFEPRPRRIFRWLTDKTVFRSTTLAGVDLSRSICISRHLKSRLLRQGVPVEHSSVIYQGIPLEDFPAKAGPGGLHSPLRVVYVGQLLYSKGVHTLIEAANLIAQARGGDAMMVSVVGGGDESYLKRLKEAVGRDTRVTFVGRMPHTALGEIYRDHDVFVFPSIGDEGFGLTQLEAMASGTTVVATGHSGHGESLENGQNALVFTRGNAAELAGHLMRVMDNPRLSRQLAENALRMVAARFTIEGFVSELEGFLLSCTGEETAAKAQQAHDESRVPRGGTKKGSTIENP